MRRQSFAALVVALLTLPSSAAAQDLSLCVSTDGTTAACNVCDRPRFSSVAAAVAEAEAVPFIPASTCGHTRRNAARKSSKNLPTK